TPRSVPTRRCSPPPCSPTTWAATRWRSSWRRARRRGLLAGLILGAMMGPTIVFTIPVALGIIEREDRSFLAQGVLAGMITIPFGVPGGGLVAGFPATMVLAILVPIVIAAALIAVGLWRIPDRMTTGFLWFGKFLVALISVGLVIGVFEFMTGARIM